MTLLQALLIWVVTGWLLAALSLCLFLKWKVLISFEFARDHARIFGLPVKDVHWKDFFTWGHVFLVFLGGIMPPVGLLTLLVHLSLLIDYAWGKSVFKRQVFERDAEAP